MCSDSSQPGEIESAIARAVVRLRAGDVVAFPTETVYGLGADAWNAAAVARVFALKGRPASNPLIVHVSGPDMARQVASSWPDWAETLARAFWPGPLTLVLPARTRSGADAAARGPLPPAVTAGGPTVAVRSPDHPAALALLYALGGPLVGPSANRSGRVSPTCAEHVRESFGAEVEVVDGGPCTAGIESTVVRWNDRDATLEILRPGVIGPSALAAALAIESSRVRLIAPSAAAPAALAEPLQSPGQLAEHYAPAAPAVLFDRHEWGLVVELARGGPIALLSFGDMLVADAASCWPMPASADEYAASLYGTLRSADASRPALIAIEAPPAPDPHCGGEAELWHAVADRLSRAARPLSRVRRSAE
ncbi:MAG: L-threonylcarbamoyladenylate synthase [Phycisphaerales bacterium]